MASLPSDRTKLALAQSNQNPGIAAGSVQNKNAITEAYDTIDLLNQKVDGLVGSSTLSPYPPAQYNKLINGGFAVNQRAVSGTVTLAAGAYGHDRWKAGAGGCTYTFSTTNNVTTITITAGSLIQVIEGVGLYSGTHTLSWSGTSQGKIGAGAFGVSGITSSVVGGTNLSIEFNVGTLSNVQFNFGSVSLPFQPRIFTEESGLCRRNFLRLSSIDNAFSWLGNGYANSVSNARIYIPLPVEMRAVPTLITSALGTFSIVQTGSAITLSAIAASAPTKNLMVLDITCSALSAGNGVALQANNTISAFIDINAEL